MLPCVAGGLFWGAEKSGIARFIQSGAVLDARQRGDWGETKKEARGGGRAEERQLRGLSRCKIVQVLNYD